MAITDGMDLDTVSTALGQINTAISDMKSAASTLNTAFTNVEQSWAGPKATQFQSAVPSATSALNSALAELVDLQTAVQQAYTIQVQASNTY